MPPCANGMGSGFRLVSLFTVFGLQGLLMWIISLPLQVGISQGHRLARRGMPIGVILWLAGLFFETVGDYQLARFKADPANQGRVMNRGLVAIHAAPQLLRRFSRVVGILSVLPPSPVRGGGRSSGRC